MRVDSQELPLSAIPLCQLLPCHLGPLWPPLSINQYVKGCLYTTGAFHMSIPAEPSLFQKSRSSMPSHASSSLDLVVTMSCGLSNHCPVISLQTLEVWLCQWPSLTGMEHCALHTRAVHAATCLERELVEVLWNSSRRFSHVLWLKVNSCWLLRKSLFSGKNKKTFSRRLLKFLPSMLCRLSRIMTMWYISACRME